MQGFFGWAIPAPTTQSTESVIGLLPLHRNMPNLPVVPGRDHCRHTLMSRRVVDVQRSDVQKRIRSWKAQGYSIEIAYLRLPSATFALSRVAARVKQGGHDVPRADVLRRYKWSWSNFLEVYRPLADDWVIYDSSKSPAKMLERRP